MNAESGAISNLNNKPEKDTNGALVAYDYHPKTNQIVCARQKSSFLHVQQATSGAKPDEIKIAGTNIEKLRLSDCGKFVTIIHENSSDEQAITLLDIKSKKTWTTPKDSGNSDAHDACLTSDAKYVIASYEGICRWWQVCDDQSLKLVSAYWNDSDAPATIHPDDQGMNQKVICLLRYPGERFQKNTIEPHKLPSDSKPFEGSKTNQLLADWEKKVRFSLRNEKGAFDYDGNVKLENE